MRNFRRKRRLEYFNTPTADNNLKDLRQILYYFSIGRHTILTGTETALAKLW